MAYLGSWKAITQTDKGDVKGYDIYDISGPVCNL